MSPPLTEAYETKKKQKVPKNYKTLVKTTSQEMNECQTLKTNLILYFLYLKCLETDVTSYGSPTRQVQGIEKDVI